MSRYCYVLLIHDVLVLTYGHYCVTVCVATLPGGREEHVCAQTGSLRAQIYSSQDAGKREGIMGGLFRLNGPCVKRMPAPPRRMERTGGVTSVVKEITT